MVAEVKITGDKELLRLIRRLGESAPKVVERGVKAAGLAAQRSLVRCYRKLGKGGRHVADTVTSPEITKSGIDAEAVVGVGHKWAELVEKGGTFKIPRRVAPPEFKAFPLIKTSEGGKLVFRASVGPGTRTIKGADCIPGALDDGLKRLVKTLEAAFEKLTKV